MNQRALQLVRFVQRHYWRGFAIHRPTARQVEQALLTAGACVARDPDFVYSHPTPPLGDGLSRILLPSGAPFTVERFLAFRYLTRRGLTGTLAPDAFFCADVAAMAAVLNGQDVREKGEAFVRRKVEALRVESWLWRDHSCAEVLMEAQLLAGHLAGVKHRSPARHLCNLGRAARQRGAYDHAIMALTQSLRYARSEEDWAAVARAILNVGLVHLHRGEFAVARALIRRSARVARRKRLRVAFARAVHDLAFLYIEVGDSEQATKWARCALRAYPRRHPGAIRLAHDFAFVALEQGRPRAASRGLRAIRRHARGALRLAVTGSLARAAGACGDRVLLMEMRSRVLEGVEACTGGAARAHALLNLSVGLFSAARWDMAEEAAGAALAAAEAAEERHVAAAARGWLEAARSRQRKGVPGVAEEEGADAFADDVVRLYSPSSS